MDFRIPNSYDNQKESYLTKHDKGPFYYEVTTSNTNCIDNRDEITASPANPPKLSEPIDCYFD